ncbi:hypothetical protein HAX54_018091 [Datura stramonium]|uniref:NADP-dependent oxidoreductase domain-containing protein n=1 Tax=Datura stramonium TaxID=4076 RepID=A0ABS8ULM2_DATST|nr:hypothetical protein [Datura stramonium]
MQQWQSASCLLPAVPCSPLSATSRSLTWFSSMGTTPPLPPTDQLVSIFINAIEAGYLYFDTAASYGSEEELGQAMSEELHCGLIESREEVFITSKLWCIETFHDLVLPALKKSLA